MIKIIDGKRYDSSTAIEIASDYYWDGHNYDRGGRNEYLMKTKKGNFFLYRTTRWQGELCAIIPISVQRAMSCYEFYPTCNVSYFDAFGVEPEEA